MVTPGKGVDGSGNQVHLRTDDPTVKEDGGKVVDPKKVDDKRIDPHGSDAIVRQTVPVISDGGTADRLDAGGKKLPVATVIGGAPFTPQRTQGERGTYNSPLAPKWPEGSGAIEDLLRNRFPMIQGLPANAAKVQEAFMKMVSSDPRAFAKRVAQKVKMDQQRRTAERNAKITKAMSDVLMAHPMATKDELFAQVQSAVGAKPLKGQFRAGEAQIYLDRFKASLDAGMDFPAANRAALKQIPVPVVVEVDAIKAASGDFANGPAPSQFKDNPLESLDGAKVGAALFNTALHPGATLVSALIFEEVVKDAVANPADYGFDHLGGEYAMAMMGGGVAAGKGFTSKNLNLPVQFIYDADGESNTTAFEGLLRIAQESNIDFMMVGIQTDPLAAYLRSLYRALDPVDGEGRIPGEIASVSSHTDGVANMMQFARHLRDTGAGQAVILTNTTDPPSRVDIDSVEVPKFEALRPQIFAITDHVRKHGTLPDDVKKRFENIPFMRDQIIPKLEKALTDPANEKMRNLVLGRLAEDRDALKKYYQA